MIPNREAVSPEVIMRQFRFSPALPEKPVFTMGDAVILLGIATILYAGTRLAFRVPAVIAGPKRIPAPHERSYCSTGIVR